MERAYDDAVAGRASAGPILEITIPSVVDPSVAPPGQHVMSMFVQYAPYRLAAGSWDDLKESFADRCIDMLAGTPPTSQSVIEREVLSPLDLERRFGLTGGNIFQGAMRLNPALLAAAAPRLGRPPHADRGALPLRRGHPPRRRRDGRLRQQRGPRDPARRAAGGLSRGSRAGSRAGSRGEPCRAGGAGDRGAVPDSKLRKSRAFALR